MRDILLYVHFKTFLFSSVAAEQHLNNHWWSTENLKSHHVVLHVGGRWRHLVRYVVCCACHGGYHGLPSYHFCFCSVMLKCFFLFKFFCFCKIWWRAKSIQFVFFLNHDVTCCDSGTDPCQWIENKNSASNSAWKHKMWHQLNIFCS